jgi:hypothetical protein
VRVAVRMMPHEAAQSSRLATQRTLTRTHPDTMLQGLAHCFVKNDEGRLSDFMVIEPISSASLECMATGALGRLRVSQPGAPGSLLLQAIAPLPLKHTRFANRRCRPILPQAPRRRSSAPRG